MSGDSLEKLADKIQYPFAVIADALGVLALPEGEYDNKYMPELKSLLPPEFNHFEIRQFIREWRHYFGSEYERLQTLRDDEISRIFGLLVEELNEKRETSKLIYK